jgi:BioD-like phosphotransacetylase family protein
MEKIIMASMRPSAGKTSLIIGLAKALGKRYGYIKPFGDRMIYKKKKLWDHDSALVAHILGLDEMMDERSIGFDHSKLRYMYDKDSIRDKLNEICDLAGKDADILFIEGGGDIAFGSSVNLDVLSLARFTKGSVIFVMSGRDDAIIDDMTFLEKNILHEGMKVKGIIFNNVVDTADFNTVHMPIIKSMSMPVLGVIPFTQELMHYTADYLADALLAKVVAGEEGLSNVITNIFVASISTDEAFRHPIFSTPKKLIITSGDRSDLILASLNTDTAAIVLTNNMMPQAKVLAMASEKKVPLLLVATDTYHTARRIDLLEPLLTNSNVGKVGLIEKLVRDNIDLKAF